MVQYHPYLFSSLPLEVSILVITVESKPHIFTFVG
jgi:hypothetical protein